MGGNGSKPKMKVLSLTDMESEFTQLSSLVDKCGDDKKKGDELLTKLEANRTDLQDWIDGNGIEDDDEDDDEDEKAEAEEAKEEGESYTAPARDPNESVEDKVKRHKAKWQLKKDKYMKYANKGKVEKLERAKERQEAKLQKAKDKGKPEIYINYKKAKVTYTKNLITTARLVRALKKAGLA